MFLWRHLFSPWIFAGFDSPLLNWQTPQCTLRMKRTPLQTDVGLGRKQALKKLYSKRSLRPATLCHTEWLVRFPVQLLAFRGAVPDSTTRPAPTQLFALQMASGTDPPLWLLCHCVMYICPVSMPARTGSLNPAQGPSRHPVQSSPPSCQ